MKTKKGSSKSAMEYIQDAWNIAFEDGKKEGIEETLTKVSKIIEEERIIYFPYRKDDAVFRLQRQITRLKGGGKK